VGENVSQATQFANSGSAQGGIIPFSLATAPPVAEAGTFALIPETWHPPLRQRMVLLKGRRRNRPSFLQLHADAAGARNPEALRLRAAGRGRLTPVTTERPGDGLDGVRGGDFAPRASSRRWWRYRWYCRRL
jgi:hypothetical protein